MHLHRISIARVALLTAALSPAYGYPQTTDAADGEAADGRRLVKLFDFLEPENPENVPMFWRRVQGTGFPHYAEGRYDHAVGHAAPPSFFLDSNGGAVGYYYYARGIPSQPGSDYEISMWVRPRSLDGARFFASAWFLDRFGNLIEGSQRSSEPIGTPGISDDWQRVEFILPGGVPGARLISVALYVVQASSVEPQDAEGVFRPIITTDVVAGAWVDDLHILRLPRIRLACDVPGSVFAPEQTPAIRASMSDPDGAGLSAELVVRSADGRERWRSAVATRTGEGFGGDEYVVPGLSPGSYSATLHIQADGRQIRAPTLHFAKLAPIPAGIRPLNRGFGIRVDNTTEELWPSVTRLADLLNIWQIKIPVWSADRPALTDSTESPGRVAFLAELYRRGGLGIAVLEGVPAELRDPRRGNKQNVVDLFDQPSQEWGEFLKYALARYASFVRFWQIGADGDRDVYLDKRLRRTIGRLAADFRELIASPQLAAPSSVLEIGAGQETPAAALSLFVPASISPYHIASHRESFASANVAHRWLAVQSLDAARYDRGAELADYVKRLVSARATGADIVFVEQPWQVRRVLGETIIEPTERFVILRTLVAVLGNARSVTPIHMGGGVRGHLFERDGRGVLVLWDDGATDADTETVAQLGGNPRRISIWGEVWPVERRGDEHVLRVSSVPVIIDGVSVELLTMGSLVRLSPDFIESGVALHEVNLELANPFARPISGRVRLDVPARWDVSPQQMEFALESGQRFRQTLGIRFPPQETVGRKTILANITLDGEREYELRIPQFVELGLRDVTVSTIAQTIGQKIIVRQRVTNFSSSPVHFEAFAAAPDRPRQNRLIPRLQPGRTAVKEYVFFNEPALNGRTIKVGLRELDGPRSYNETIEVP